MRRLELALLDPVASPALVGDPAAWRDGLAARAAALRQVERAVAGDLAEGAAAWREDQERRLRSWLLLAGAVLVVSMAAAVATLRLHDGGREPALAAGGTVLGLARRGQALANRQLQLLEGLARDESDPQRQRDLLGADNPGRPAAPHRRDHARRGRPGTGAPTLPAPAGRRRAPRRRRRGRARRGRQGRRGPTPAGRGILARPGLTRPPGPRPTRRPPPAAGSSSSPTATARRPWPSPGLPRRPARAAG